MAMNGPAPVALMPPPGGNGAPVCCSRMGIVAAGTEGRAVGGPTDPDGIGWGWPTCPVGSNSTQPVPGKYTSTHQCAEAAETTSWLFVRLPGRKPYATRAGIPDARSITVIALA